MTLNVGVWIDHKRAVIVSASAGHVTTRTVTSGVDPHPRYSGGQDSGGETKYDERHRDQLDRYYDGVIDQMGAVDSLLILGPGEAKGEFKARLGRLKAPAARAVAVEAADKLTEPQIVARVKEHFGIGD